MSYKLSKSKRIQAAVVLAIAALLAMTGTFAWFNFSQRKINVFHFQSAPNVNLHDDFAGGPEKDVYVENSGQHPVLVRVRLTELLIQNGVLLPAGASDDEVGTNWHIHTALENICEVCGFEAHEYFKWTMNGQKFYMPAPNSAKGLKLDEDTYTEPLAVGDLDAIIDYAALLRTAFAGNQAVLEYIDEYLGGDASHAAELQAEIAAIDPDVEVPNVRQYDGQTDELTRKLNEVRLTLIPSQIMTMQEWIDGGGKTGNFWVMDDDGWCYWASALKSGEATGQLLSSVDNIKNSAGELIYRINVVLNATTYSGTELNDFFLAAPDGITEDAKNLMLSVAGGYITGDDGNLYIDDGSGLYRMVTQNNDGSGDVTISNPIFAGPDDKIGTEDDLAVGFAFSLDIDNKIVVKDEGNDYIIENFEVGGNGVVYIGIGGGRCLASIDEDGTPSANGDRYTIVFAGEDGIIGTEDDKGLEERVFHHIGNGVYVEIENKDDTISKDNPVKYYFSSTIFNDNPYVVNNLDGNPINTKLGAIFSLTLYVGEEFCVWDSKETGSTIILTGEEMAAALHVMEGVETTFTMRELYELSGQLYIDLSDNDGGYSNLYIAGTGENGEFGGQYFGNLAEVIEGVMTPTVSNKAAGTGDSDNPFKIQSRYEMDWITGEVLNGNDFAGKYFVVKNSFSMGAKDFLPIGSNTNQFKGRFDGGGFTISNLKISSNGDYVGLFGYVGTGGVVENFALENAVVNGNANVGGVVGHNNGTVTGCDNMMGTVTGKNNTGGIVGQNANGSTVTDCYNSGIVNGNNNTGGVVGSNGGTVQTSYNTGAVTNTGDNTGGVAGNNTGTVQTSYNTGTVTSTGTAKNTGGVVGLNTNGTVQTSYSTGAVNGYIFVGGVIGTNDAAGLKVTNCYAWGNVTGYGMVGGVIGFNGVGNCSFVYHAKGTVSGNEMVGGVAGYSSGGLVLTGNVALADAVTGTSTFGINRLVGYLGNTLTATRCYSYPMPCKNNGSGVPGTNVASKTPNWSTFWLNASSGPGFNSSVWRWDDTNSLPVLQNVTP